MERWKDGDYWSFMKFFFMFADVQIHAHCADLRGAAALSLMRNDRSSKGV